MTPDKSEFTLGIDNYGRRVQLTRERKSNGTFTWSIGRAAANQRDDSPVIRDLPEALMLRLAAVIAKQTGTPT